MYAYKGFQYNNNNDEFLPYNKKFDKSNISYANNSTKITSVISNNNNSSAAFPSIYYGDKANKNTSTKTEYLTINPESNISSVNGLETRNSKYSNNIKKLLKYMKKDKFSLSSPRWDQGYFHDNASHFQVPGPAYYTPKIQNTKKSFNLNNKDFIYTNSLPFKNDDFYSISNVFV